jgi:hypothetical protein
VKLSRKLALGVMVFVLPVATVIMVGAGTASAKGTKEKGTITCSTLTGTISFSPPLVNGGTANETITGTITVKGCKKLKKATVIPKSGSVAITGIGGGSTNDCTSLEGSGSASSITFTTKWSPKTIASSVTTFSGYDTTTAGNGDEGFALPNAVAPPTPSGSTVGSYPDTAATATASTNQTAAQIATSCGSGGLATLTIANGVEST